MMKFLLGEKFYKKYKKFYRHLLKVYNSVSINEINFEFEFYLNGCDNLRLEVYDQCLSYQYK